MLSLHTLVVQYRHGCLICNFINMCKGICAAKVYSLLEYSKTEMKGGRINPWHACTGVCLCVCLLPKLQLHHSFLYSNHFIRTSTCTNLIIHSCSTKIQIFGWVAGHTLSPLPSSTINPLAKIIPPLITYTHIVLRIIVFFIGM